MGYADLHIHTTHSWDAYCTVSAILKQVRDHTDLDVFAITDHDEVNGALEALELAPYYGIEVIPGSEISTAEGHLLAIFIQQRIPAGLSLVETVLRVGELGGLCIAAHPNLRGSGLTSETIRRALALPEVARVLVGIEAFNAGLLFNESNRSTLELADGLDIAQVGGSDAHLAWMVGQGATEYPGSGAEDLRRALVNHTTRPMVGAQRGVPRLVRGWLSGYLLRKAGWVTSNQDPAAPLRLARLAHN